MCLPSTYKLKIIHSNIVFMHDMGIPGYGTYTDVCGMGDYMTNDETFNV